VVTTPPATALVLPAPTSDISGVTTVHTGEAFAGSTPYVLAVSATGFGLIGFGLLRRRQVRAQEVEA
jgi:hypothetical protein